MKGHDPNKAFFLVLPIDLNDGSISRIDIEGRMSFRYENAAVGYADVDTRANGGALMVFRCEPVKRAGENE